MSRRTLINLVFFVAVFAVMLVWATRNVVSIRSLERPYTVSGEFAAAVGLRAESEVAYLGVRYGRVKAVENIAGGVRIQMDIDRNKKIPADATARVFRKSAIGEPYIDFVPPEGYEGGGPFMQAGDKVPMERTTIPLEFSELLRSASRLISGIDPAKAGSLIHELSLALEGRTQSLRDLTEAADELSATFVERTDVLDRLATNNTRLTRVVAEHRGSLGQALTNLRLIAESLREASPDLITVLDDGTELFGQAADLVADQKGNLDCILHDLVNVIDTATTPARLDGLRTLLTRAPAGFGAVWATRDVEADGVWVRVNLSVHPEHPAEQYVPPHELPAVPAVGACASVIGAGTTSAADFIPSAVVSVAASASLPATGGLAVAWLAGILAATAAAFRLVARAERRPARR